MTTRFATVMALIAALIVFRIEPASAETTLVAVASNFSRTMNELATDFAAVTGHKAELSSGATGKIYAQITQGAPYDIFLSGDTATAEKLLQEGLAVPGTQFVYARGKLLLWSSRPGLVDSDAKILDTDHFTHLAIANPALAPYGSAAVEYLKNTKRYDTIASRIVMGENINQTFEFIASGAAELGFISASQIMTGDPAPEGSYWVVPEAQYTPLDQAAVMLRKGEKNAAAVALLSYLKSSRARAIITKYGYVLENLNPSAPAR